MKTNLKLLAVAALALGFSMSVNAATGTATGTATVVQAVTVTKKVDLAFGSVSQGIDKTINLNSTVAGTPNVGTHTAGQFLVSAATGTAVHVAFTTPATGLLLGGTGVPLEITNYTYAWGLTNASQANTFSAATDISIGTNEAETGVNGVFVFIGGTAHPTAGQTIGDYSGTITLTATYN